LFSTFEDVYTCRALAGELNVRDRLRRMMNGRKRTWKRIEGIEGIRGIRGIRGRRQRDKMRREFHLHSMKFSLSSGSVHVPEF
jgi:hypothetical protein